MELIRSIAAAYPRPFRVNDIAIIHKIVTGRDVNRHTLVTYLQDMTRDGSMAKVNLAGGATRNNFYFSPPKPRTIEIPVGTVLPLYMNRGNPDAGTWGMQCSCFVLPVDLVEMASVVKYHDVATTEVVNDTYREFDSIVPSSTLVSPFISVANVMLHAFSSNGEFDGSKGKMTVQCPNADGRPPFQVLRGWNVIEDLVKKVVLARVAGVQLPSFPVIVTISITNRDDASVALLNRSIDLIEIEHEAGEVTRNAIKKEIDLIIRSLKAQKDPETQARKEALDKKEKELHDEINRLQRELAATKHEKASFLASLEGKTIPPYGSRPGRRPGSRNRD